MQQTDKYQLNLIENEDTFSPDPLNGNAEKLEAALIRLEGADAAEAQARAAADKALDQRIRVFEARHLAIGTYKLQSTAVTEVNLGFDPAAVIILSTNSYFIGGMLLPDAGGNGKIIPNGFQVSASSAAGTINNSHGTFAYVAFG